MVLIVCTSSDHTLYLYIVLEKYLYVFQSYQVDTKKKRTKGNNFINNRATMALDRSITELRLAMKVKR